MSFYLCNVCARVCQQVAENPPPERFTTETPLEREWRFLNSAIARKGKKTARNHGAQGQHRLALRGIHFTPLKAHM